MILIESQWNLNFAHLHPRLAHNTILIELQWNLNSGAILSMLESKGDINRITVEFKY